MAASARCKILVLFLFVAVPGLTQDAQQPYGFGIRKADSEILLDGSLAEPAWQDASVADRFFQNFPYDTTFAEMRTRVRITFDDHFLYIAAEMAQPKQEITVASLKRDFGYNGNDHFSVNIDPFQDKLNGFHFAVTPYNVQREGLIVNGSDISFDWDNKWFSEVKVYPDRWVVEMAIPFKTLRYKKYPGENTWRINFSRNAVQQNEWSTWVPIPRQFAANNLAFSGRMSWEDPLPEPGLNVSLIPYLTGRTERDFEFRLPAELDAGAGMDAKIAVTPSLNLDLTVNPDFSQVEVDQQVTNLSRFELFFPERRQFFLENEDLFSLFGFPGSRPFFSRRIGLANGDIVKETTEGDTIEVNRNLSVPILAGARLSGKLDKNWRMGLLNMQTGKVKDIGLAPANYSVGVLQRRVFNRSYIGAVVVNKENFREKAHGGYEHDPDGYNRVVGLEYNLYSKDNKWEGEAFYHRSFSNGDNRDAQAAAIFIGRFTREWRLYLPMHYIGQNHRADVGFIPRRGFYSLSPGFRRTFFPKNGSWLSEQLISWSIGIDNAFTFNLPKYNLTDRSQSTSLILEFPGSSEFSLGYENNFVHLFFPFDPTNSGGEQLPEGSEFTNNAVGFGFRSDLRKKLYFNCGSGYSGYYNGTLFDANFELNYRWQPFGTLALRVVYNDISLPDPYNSARFWLVGPRAELSFSRAFFFSAFLQYNTQLNNVNINARIQLRYRPVSDIFLVYTDNYFSDQFFQQPTVKNRAIVLKATYWLNL